MMRMSFPRMFSFVVGVCLVGAGCAHDDGFVASNLETSIQPPVATANLPTEDVSGPSPLAALPGQTVVAVKSTRYPNGLRQDISFVRGPIRAIGNGMTIVALTSSGTSLEEGAPLFKPSEAAIRSEIGAQFPHVAMQVVERESGNAYGPYGLALGRVGSDVRCLYAWQYIDANRLPAEAVREPMSLRVRLCQAGTTFDAMAAALDHLVIGSVADPHVAALSSGVDPRRILVSTAPTAPARHKSRHLLASRTTHFAKQAGPHPVEAWPRLAVVESPAAPIGTDLPPEAYLGPNTSGARRASVPHE